MTIRKTYLPILLLLPSLLSCGGPGKLESIRSEGLRADLALPADRQAAFRQIDAGAPQRDTLFVRDDDGRTLTLMRTMEVDGEVMAGETLDAAVVTARFRNIAERHGRIALEFDVIVPRRMLDSRWKLRFDPDMFVLDDSLRLEPVYVTGALYRRRQARGEELFARYLRGIVADTSVFRWAWQLDLFLERNIPQVFAFADDTTLVDVDRFEAVRVAQEREYASRTGVTVREAVDHYTNWLLRHRNDRKIRRIGKMRSRYIKDPIVRDGVRLDTVIVEPNGDFRYRYVQDVATRPKLRKIDVVLSGEIFEDGKPVYAIPPCDPLTFYVSSFAGLVSDEQRFLTRVVERRVEANTACYIAFHAGRHDIDESLGRNPSEMGRIRRTLRDVLDHEAFELDSMTVTSFASPEGSEGANRALCARRAASAGDYFGRYAKAVQDSLEREAGLLLTVGDDGGSSAMRSAYERADLRFSSRSGGENWRMLDYLVETDSLLDDGAKRRYAEVRESLPDDPDACEEALKKEPFYTDIRSRLYPYCRVVAFAFHMHRRGMAKDTVHTTVLDSTYMAGVQAIRDRDYEAAAAALRDYADYNCAVAYAALDRNRSAMAILEGLPRTPKTDYLMAILHSREGDDRAAVERYLAACAKDRSFVSRGNLDPEISVLIRRYGLNAEPEDDYMQ